MIEFFLYLLLIDHNLKYVKNKNIYMVNVLNE